MSAGVDMDVRMQKRMFFRSLFIQSCWSFERMQGLGFAYCLEPWIERCYADHGAEAAEARLRHQEFFNTQPYMSPLVIGMVCALEKDIAATAASERLPKIKRLRALKSAAASALAGLGDALFWGALRPLCAVLALMGVLSLSLCKPWMSAAVAIIVYLGIHNVVIMPWRWRFLRLGYEWKDQIAVRLGDWSGQRLIRYLRCGGAVAGLAVFAMMLWLAPEEQRLSGAVAFMVALGLKTWRISAYQLYTAAILAGVVAAWIGWL